MPTYVYECPEHGRFEVIKPMADSGREETCLRCEDETDSQPKTRRVYTVPSIQGETVPGGVHGGSGDGYVLDSKSGLTSRRPKRKEWF